MFKLLSFYISILFIMDLYLNFLGKYYGCSNVRSHKRYILVLNLTYVGTIYAYLVKSD
ncbi:hypothetical protein DFJ77DRAFT_482050 [Powellomyces hirtus]|nr:hypothetical protein DFJ77DRAFT_482050 [Powellomyces hirtus]